MSVYPTAWLEELTVGVQYALQDTPQARESLRIRTDRDRARDLLVLRITAGVLAERLPPERLHGVVTVPRWATWRDHLKDTWRGRWWFAWVVRRWPVRYIDEPVPVVVPVRSWWKYPHTPHILSHGQGYSALHVETDQAASPWDIPRA